jgi:Lar family restriction alleviation protein
MLDAYWGRVEPCPFCGTTDLDMETHRGYHVLCQACVTVGPLGCTEDEALCRWNARPPVEVRPPHG